MKYPIEVIRHSTAHLLAAAIKELFPNAKLGIGPAIDNGFYYDFEFTQPLRPELLPKIEKQMRAIIKRNLPFIRQEINLEEAKSLFAGQPYKLELIDELARDKQPITIYITGKKTIGNWELGIGNSFFDLCRGPHVAGTADLGIFKLTTVAGAYWKGDEKNKMLTRVYGLAFATQKELDDYLIMLAEAEKRDHRKLGKELELFIISPEAGMGLPLWTPKGTTIREALIQFLREEQMKRGYQPVVTPHIGRLDLYQTSGHWQHYHEMMYPPIQVKIDEEEFLLKPMNCPHHVLIFKSRAWSYRDLPVRLAEFGTVYRYEKSGELSGLTRVRSFTQDDAHLFVRPDQIKEEFAKVVDLVLYVFKVLQFKTYRVRLGLRDPNSNKYVGEGKLWAKAEADIEAVVKAKKLNCSKEEGEAAFYGPKLDFVVKDVLGREWQLGTVQIDYNLPELFKLEYIDKGGQKARPIMIHRAPFGSLERFIGILIEHYAGAFPAWLSPVQVYLTPVGKAHFAPAKKLGKLLQADGLRVEIDGNNETVSYKVRKAEKQKIPYILVIGDKEAKLKTLNVRLRGVKEIKKMSVKKFIEAIKKEVAERK